VTQAAPAVRTCSECERQIDGCAFCDDPDCRTAVCYRCVSAALQEAGPRLHDHGG